MSKAQPPTTDTDDFLNPKVNASALDFLLIELVPLAQRITEQVLAREQALIDEYRQSRIFNHESRAQTYGAQTSEDSNPREAKASARDRSTKDAATGKPVEPTTSLGFSPVSEEAREGIFWRLDRMGYRVGQGLVER